MEANLEGDLEDLEGDLEELEGDENLETEGETDLVTEEDNVPTELSELFPELFTELSVLFSELFELLYFSLTLSILSSMASPTFDFTSSTFGLSYLEYAFFQLSINSSISSMLL
jgi:hypothetical protein